MFFDKHRSSVVGWSWLGILCASGCADAALSCIVDLTRGHRRPFNGPTTYIVSKDLFSNLLSRCTLSPARIYQLSSFSPNHMEAGSGGGLKKSKNQKSQTSEEDGGG